MTTRNKRLLIALFFFILALFSGFNFVQAGFSGSYWLYSLILLLVSALFFKNAIRP